MTQKARKTLMALVGAYLAYTGISLILEVTKSNPKNMTAFVLVGLFFVAFGALTIVLNVKGFIAESKKEQEEAQALEDLTEAPETVEAAVAAETAEAAEEEETAEESEEDTEEEDAEDSEVELDEDAQPVDKEGDE